MSLRSYIVPGPPAPKPRQTQRDRWMVRPEVARYRAWADIVRMATCRERGTVFEFRFFLPMPPSWSVKKRGAMSGQPHSQKPDIDNLIKAALDAMLPSGDQAVWRIACAEKRWEDGQGPRTEIVARSGLDPAVTKSA